MDNKTNPFQKILIDHLSSILSKNISLVDSIADILEISNDSAYRRIRGETSLSIDESVKLCNHYNISFDSLFKSNQNSASFNFPSLETDIGGFIKYLQGIEKNFILLNNTNNPHLYYTADDIPFFYLFKNPLLVNFKMFYWMKSVMNISILSAIKFEEYEIIDEIKEIGKNILKFYLEIPSTEIWNDNTIISICKQIEYYYDADFFEKKETAVTLTNELILFIENIKKSAEESSKDIRFSNNFNLYFSDVELGNNCIFISADNFQQVFLTFNTFNNMTTTNNYFCGEVDVWLKNMIKKSSLISGISEKQRAQFFNRIIEIVRSTQKRIINKF